MKENKFPPTSKYPIETDTMIAKCHFKSVSTKWHIESQHAYTHTHQIHVNMFMGLKICAKLMNSYLYCKVDRSL